MSAWSLPDLKDAATTFAFRAALARQLISVLRGNQRMHGVLALRRLLQFVTEVRFG